MRKKVTCIICPLGCRIRVVHSKDSIQRIDYYQCKKGKDYAVQEVFNPLRTLTTTLTVKNGELPLVSVKTDKAVPRDRIFDIMDSTAGLELEAPLAIGEIMVEDILGLNANLIATKHVLRKEK